MPCGNGGQALVGFVKVVEVVSESAVAVFQILLNVSYASDLICVSRAYCGCGLVKLFGDALPCDEQSFLGVLYLGVDLSDHLTGIFEIVSQRNVSAEELGRRKLVAFLTYLVLVEV